MKKIYELKNQRALILAEAEAALTENDMDKYSTKMAEVKNQNTQISALEELEKESEMFADLKNNKLDAGAMLTERNDKEYMDAFFHAVTNGYTLKSGRGVEQLRPLYNALSETGIPPGGQDGGWLVPMDFNNLINEQRRSMISLANYFSVETVKTLSGWRVVDTAPTLGFAAIGEMAPVPVIGDQPLFTRVVYTLVKYGLIVPVSSELIADNTAGLMAYLARWFAKKGVITENALLTALLLANTVPATLTAGTEFEDLKTAFTMALDPAISLNSIVLTNQSGYAMLDELTDVNGRPLMQPDPTTATPMMFKNKPVVMMSDVYLPNRVVGADTLAPIYMGDFTQFGTLFRRDPLEVGSTDIGGAAWTNDNTEVRGLIRLDAQLFDATAAIRREIVVI